MKSTKRGGPKNSKVSKNIAELLKESARDDLIITNEYNAFLHTWDETYPDWVADRIAELLKTKQRDRRYSWSASGAGKCKRRQVFQFLGMPVVGAYNPHLFKIFLTGTWTHLRHQAVFLTAGILDEIEVTVKHKKTRSRATLDGMGTAKSGRYEGAEFGFELKSTNENSYNQQITKGASEGVRLQVDFQFLMTGFDLFVIFNENKNNQTGQEWIIVRDKDRVEAMAEQVRELNMAVETHQLPAVLPACQKKLKSGEFYKCPYGGDGGVCASSGKWPNRIP